MGIPYPIRSREWPISKNPPCIRCWCRLQQKGYLETYDQPYQGRNRKYYFMTEAGKRQYQYYVEEWKRYSAEVEEIMMGGIQNE